MLAASHGGTDTTMANPARAPELRRIFGDALYSEGLGKSPNIAGAIVQHEERRPSSAEQRITQLERELRRKEKALAEAAELLMLQALTGDEGISWTTTARNTDAPSRQGARQVAPAPMT